MGNIRGKYKNANGKDVTEKQMLFCREYIIDFNAKQAAIRAGYPEKSAAVEAHKLLKTAPIQNYLSSIKKEVSDRLNVTVDDIMKELMSIGFSNIRDFIDDDNKIKNLSSVKRKKTSSISHYKITRSEFGKGSHEGKKETVEIRFHDKLSALEKIAKRINFYPDGMSAEGDGSGETVHMDADEFLNFVNRKIGQV